MFNTSRRHALAMLATAVAAATTGVVSCGKGEGAASASNPVPGKISVVTPPPDTTRPAAEAGLPSGYHAVFDQSGAKATDVSYSENQPGRWQVTTGPAHILFSPGDTARKKYVVSATFEQLQAPSHPEAFGVFIGGSKLATPNTRYTYFLVRGDGMYMVKVRDGATTRTVTDWTAHPSIPRQDASGKALYGIRIQVADRTANVSVNGIPITTISGKDMPLDGIAGVRINHNLHLLVTPASLIR